MGRINLNHGGIRGSVRPSSDGSGGGAVTIGSGKGTSDDPQVRQTTTFDSNGNVTGSHTKVTVDGQEW